MSETGDHRVVIDLLNEEFGAGNWQLVLTDGQGGEPTVVSGRPAVATAGPAVKNGEVRERHVPQKDYAYKQASSAGRSGNADLKLCNSCGVNAIPRNHRECRDCRMVYAGIDPGELVLCGRCGVRRHQRRYRRCWDCWTARK